MTAVSFAEWIQAREAGVTVFAVGPVAAPSGLYADRAAAELAADEAGGSYTEWAGGHGRQVLTAEAEAYAAAYPGRPEPEPEAEREASI